MRRVLYLLPALAAATMVFALTVHAQVGHSPRHTAEAGDATVWQTAELDLQAPSHVQHHDVVAGEATTEEAHPVSVPEPGAWLLLLSGLGALIGLAAYRRAAPPSRAEATRT